MVGRTVTFAIAAVVIVSLITASRLLVGERWSLRGAAQATAPSHV
jgi:hypothetical protein